MGSASRAVISILEGLVQLRGEGRGQGCMPHAWCKVSMHEGQYCGGSAGSTVGAVLAVLCHFGGAHGGAPGLCTESRTGGGSGSSIGWGHSFAFGGNRGETCGGMCTGCEPKRGSSSVAISDRNHHRDGERVTAWSHSSRRMPDGMHEAAMSLALVMTVNDCASPWKNCIQTHVVSIQFKVGQLLDPDSIHLGCQGSTSCTTARAGAITHHRNRLGQPCCSWLCW